MLADRVDPVRDIDALDVLPLQARMRMLEDSLEAGLRYSSELAEHIRHSALEADDDDENNEDDADAETLGRNTLKQWIKDAGEYL